jgi:hypothetical protein
VKIQTFIFNWKNQYDKTKHKIEQLSKIGVTPIIINSDDDHREEGWVNIGEESYFTDQFIAALNNFSKDSDILFHIQGDASYDNWEKLYEDAEKYFHETNWGIYAPNVDYTWYDSSRTDLDNLDMGIENLKFVADTDCTCWFIHKDIIQEYHTRKLDFSPYKMGWCWDIVFPAISYIMKRPVLRDYSHTIDHPPGTNYNKEQAEKEMAAMYQSLPADLQTAFSYIKGDRRYLAYYYK